MVASFIDENDKSVIDIGCDHGLLSIYLAEKFNNLKIIASDVNNNALESARRNVSKYKLEDRIDIRLGSGVSVINKKDKIDTLVVAGMGANTIIGFLKYSQDKLKDINKIIIQSNTDLFFLRKNMVSMGYYIDDEELVLDKNIIYTVIEFKRGAEKYDYKQIYFGPRLMENKDELFNEYYSKKFLKYENLLLQLPKNSLVSKLHHMRLMKIIKEEVEINDNEKDN